MTVLVVTRILNPFYISISVDFFGSTRRSVITDLFEVPQIQDSS